MPSLTPATSKIAALVCVGVALCAIASEHRVRARNRELHAFNSRLTRELRSLTEKECNEKECNEAADLKACLAWAHKSDKSFLHPLTDGRDLACSVPLSDKKEARARVESDGKAIVPADAHDMCQVIDFLITQGQLPHMHDNVRRSAAAVLIDVGAAFGGELLIGHKMGFHVESFEAREDEFKLLNATWGTLPRVHIVNAAVSNVPGGHSKMELFNAADSSSLHANAVTGEKEKRKADKQAAAGNSRIISVEAVSLDYALAGVHGRVSFIKADVQGHEYEVLLSASGLLRRDRPALYFEYSPNFRGSKAPEVLCLAKDLGYECVFRGNMVVCAHALQRIINGYTAR